MSGEEFLTRAQQEGTPLVEGDTATFVWQGAEPPVLRGDFNGWATENTPAWEPADAGRRKGRKAAERVWVARLPLAADAYMEYGLGPDKARVPDSFNRRKLPNGMGEFNHWFYMPQGGPTPLAQRRPGVPTGVVTRHDAPTYMFVAGKQRRVDLYRPPVDGPAPLMVVYDGSDFKRRASLPTMVDNLIAEGRIAPIALAMVANGGGSRMAEYGCSDTALLFVHQIVLPLAQKHLDLVDPAQQPGAYGVMGASMGGLMSVYTALRLPQVFGRVLSQSGAFHLREHVTMAVELAQVLPPPPVHIWMDVGRYEWLLDSNRRMHALLRERGYDVTYREFSAGHNYPAWRDDLWRGLEALFPPATPKSID